MNPSTAIWTAAPSPALLASRHKDTGRLRFPPLPASSPLAGDHETVSVPPRGTVYSYSVIHPNPKSGAKPFAVGYVLLDGPVRLFGRIDGPVAIGATCEARPDDEFGFAFDVKGERA